METYENGLDEKQKNVTVIRVSSLPHIYSKKKGFFGVLWDLQFYFSKRNEYTLFNGV